jgi:hypothetical protein
MKLSDTDLLKTAEPLIYIYWACAMIAQGILQYQPTTTAVAVVAVAAAAAAAAAAAKMGARCAEQ